MVVIIESDSDEDHVLAGVIRGQSADIGGEAQKGTKSKPNVDGRFPE